jgi:hypothetical protein
MNPHTKVLINLTKQDIHIQSKHSHVDKNMINSEQVLQDEEVKIQGFAKPPRLYLEFDPRSRITNLLHWRV